MDSVNNKIVLITGASRGLGEWTARRFGKAGAKVVLVGRSRPDLASVAEAIAGDGGVADYLVGDITDQSFVRHLFEHIDSSHNTIDILVNNAGVGFFGSIDELTVAELDEMLHVNLYGTIFCCQEAVRRMKLSRGHIVNVVSTAGKVGRALEAGYAASKWALAGFTESLRLEVKPYGIRVTSFCPGGMNTPFWHTESGRKHQPKSHTFLDPRTVADLLFSVVACPQEAVVDEIIIRRS